MLVRQDTQDPAIVWLVTQPAHAWIAGQLARAWGNQEFGTFTPREEVCLATEQHDVGWSAADNVPELDPQTGRPHSFLTIPVALRQWIWQGAAERHVLPQSRYAALLVSTHATQLHEQWQPRGGVDASGEAQIIHTLLEHEAMFQETLLHELRADPTYAPLVAPDVLARNYAILKTCDWFSLRLCGRLGDRSGEQHAGERIMVEGVPAATGQTTLSLERADTPGTQRVRVTPWPFGHDAVHILWEERPLRGTFTDETAMRGAIRQTPYVTRAMVLIPGD